MKVLKWANTYYYHETEEMEWKVGKSKEHIRIHKQGEDKWGDFKSRWLFAMCNIIQHLAFSIWKKSPWRKYWQS